MKVRVLKTGIHRGEEAIVWGNDRSGMIVFSGCHLTCNFCYTPETSVLKLGEDLEVDEWLNRVAGLLAEGAHNIALISPTHFWARVEPALAILKAGMGRDIPLVLKVSGYESPSFSARMADLGDVLVPDFKVWSAEVARRVGLPENYGEMALGSIRTLMKTHGQERWNSGKLQRGIVVRHLLMPGCEPDSLEVVEALGRIGYRGTFNLMTYFVAPGRGLIQADSRRVIQLSARARKMGMSVVIDGKGTEDRRVA